MKLVEKLKSEKGSVYIYSILIVFVLSILGVSLMGVVSSNFKMSMITSEKNKAFYLADGAIEEALWELHFEVANARDEAREWINGPYREDEDWREFVSALYDSEELELDEIREIIEQKLEDAFREKYFDILTSSGKLDSDITGRLEDVSIEMGSEGRKKSGVERVEVNSEYKPGDEMIQVEISSAAKYNKVGKKAQLRLNIISPGLEAKSEEEKPPVETKVFKMNELYMRAVTCEGDMVAVGGKVEIEGDVYAYGTYPKGIRSSNDEIGGIVSGFTGEAFVRENKNLNDGQRADFPTGKGKLLIKGTAATKTNIQTRSSGSTLEIDNFLRKKKIIEYDKDSNDYTIKDSEAILIQGNAYCNSVILGRNAHESVIDIAGDAIMYDDMEINGNGKIIVGSDGPGEVWALLDGDPAGIYNDRSGSIIVNSDGAGDVGKSVSANNIFLAGTSYMNVRDGDDKLYQTGESVSLSKYSYFYQDEYEGETGVTYKEYKDGGDNVYSFVDLGKDEKIRHFLRYADDNPSYISDDDKNIAQIAEIGEGEGSADNYALGAVVANGNIYDPDGVLEGEYENGQISSGSFMDIGTFQENSKDKIRDIDWQTSLLGKRDYENNMNKKEIFDKMYKKDIFDEMYKNATRKEEIESLGRVKVVTDRDVYMNGSFSGKGLKINDPDSNGISGIILTTGNVFICGETDFRGAIVAKGNVMFMGAGEKKISYDEGIVVDIVSDDEDLYEIFYGDTGKKFEVAEGSTIENNLGIGVAEDGIEKTVISNYGSLNFGNSFDDIMEFVSWKEID